MIKAVIFDLDGTLLNTIDDLANACNYSLTIQGFPTHETEKYKTFVGSGVYKLMERILPIDKRNKDIMDKTLGYFEEYYEQHMVDMTKPYENILETLQKLKTREVKLAVVSNKAHQFTLEVVNKFFGNTFEIVYGKREGYPIKPNPLSVEEVLFKLEITKEECLYVGDSDIDIETAKNAGVKSVGVIWGFRGKGELEKAGADYLINNPDELLEIL